VLAWTAWESVGCVPVGSTIWVNDTVAPPGFIKENGALLSRTTYPRLAAYALASSNLVSEASWAGGNTGGFSTGDLATAFRISDTRGEFTRGYDDGRGVDSGCVFGTHQGDTLRDHSPCSSTPLAIMPRSFLDSGGNNIEPAFPSKLLSRSRYWNCHRDYFS
jgi:hypothetical protein